MAHIGRKGLCFIAGAVISLVVDSVLYRRHRRLPELSASLLADACAITALVAVARVDGAAQAARDAHGRHRASTSP